ncbi:MAG: ABC transporter permease [Blastocatellia bacterium]|nr:ABC transporter permease [Blastocatellia bacterium]
MSTPTPNLKNRDLKRARFSRIFVVFGKEFRETFRDTRVLFGVVISPLLITPLLFAAIGFFVNQKIAEEKQETLSVALVGAEQTQDLTDTLKKDGTLKLTMLPNLAEAEKQVKDRVQRAALILPANAKTSLDAGETLNVELLFDQSNEKSRNAQGRLKEALKTFNEATLTTRLQARGLSQSLIKPTEVKSRNLASDKATGSLILAMLLPYVIVLSSAFGGMTSAFDTCAGEKERGTMETLLVSPVSRTEIILGKVLTIASVGMVSAVCSIIGILIAFQGGLRALGPEAQGKISFSYPAIGITLLLVIPLTLFVSSILLVISSFARNQKEAQSYALPGIMLVILPAMLSMFLGEESSISYSVVPILNTALVIKQQLTNVVNYQFIGLALGSSLLYAAVALAVVVALFNREEILFRS